MLEKSSIFLYLTVGSVFLCVGSKTHPNKYDIIKLAINNICMAVSGMLFVIHTRNFLFVHIQKINNLRRYHQQRNCGLWDFSSTYIISFTISQMYMYTFTGIKQVANYTICPVIPQVIEKELLIGMK